MLACLLNHGSPIFHFPDGQKLTTVQAGQGHIMQALLFFFTLASAVQKPLAAVPVHFNIPHPFIIVMLHKFPFNYNF